MRAFKLKPTFSERASTEMELEIEVEAETETETDSTNEIRQGAGRYEKT